MPEGDAAEGRNKAVTEIKDFVAEKVEAGIKPLREENERMAVQLSKMNEAKREEDRRSVARVTDEGHIKVRSGRLAGWDAFALTCTEGMLTEYCRSEGRGDWRGTRLGEDIVEGRNQIAALITPDGIAEWGENATKAMRSTMSPTVAIKRRALDRYADSIGSHQTEMRKYAIKALDSTTTAKGDELVPTFETSEVWRDVNLATPVAALIPQRAMPTQPYDLPYDFGDVNWYPSAENVQGATSDPSTGKTTLTAKGLKAGVPYSDELSEDAIIAFVPELRASLVRNAAEIIDNVILNADQTAASGINSDGATITTSSAGKAHWLLGLDGLIHQALIDNSSQATDVNAAVSASGVYNQVLRSLGKYAGSQVRGDVVMVCDVNTAIASLALDEVETIDKLGVRATISTGELAAIYGVPLIQSEQMALADVDGKVTDAGNVENNGRVLAFNATQWALGFRRGITVEPQREAGKGQTTIWVSMRIALVPRGTRSSNTHTSIAYNITGV
jgi:HK97 family phage major capsid protein